MDEEQDGDLLHNNYRRAKQTRFCAVSCADPDDAISIFGNYTRTGGTPIVCMPRRSSCAPYLIIPDGCYAIGTKHGKYDGVWNAGFKWCLPWTKIQFMVTQQNFQFDVPVRNCPTIDNIIIRIEVSIIMRVKKEEQDIINFIYRTSVSQLNELLDAAISERVRVLIRSKTHLEAYNIKGKEHTSQMVDYMNEIFAEKGIEIRSVIITNVLLEPGIADELQEKTSYASFNTLKKKEQIYEIRIINDTQEIALKREKMEQRRLAEIERYKKSKAEIEKEHQLILAETDKMISEIEAEGNAKVKKETADAQLEAQEVIAETNMIKAEFLADGHAKVEEVKADVENYVKKVEAKAELNISENVAQELKIKGRAESELAKNFASKRSFEENMSKLGVIKELAKNDSVTILSNHKKNLLAQLESFDRVGKLKGSEMAPYMLPILAALKDK